MVNVLPYGASAALIECEPNEVFGLTNVLARSGKFTEVVPAESTVLVCWDLDISVPEISGLCEISSDENLQDVGKLVEIPVIYDGEDLSEVAKLIGISETELVKIHSETIYRAAFAGFAPGFLYCTGLPKILQLPRRATPRVKVPAGSLAIADIYTAIYPINSPGGWHLIGSTEVAMFDLNSDKPSLLTPGDRIKFVSKTSS